MCVLMCKWKDKNCVDFVSQTYKMTTRQSYKENVAVNICDNLP